MLRISRRAAMWVAPLAADSCRHLVDGVGTDRHQEWRMAALGCRPRQHEVLGARSNQPRQRQEPPGGMAVEGRQLRPAAAEQPGSHTAHGRRRALHDGRYAPVGCRDRRRDRRNVVDVSAGRRRPRRHGAAQRLARRRVLDRRQAAARHPDHPRLSHGVARREDRFAGSARSAATASSISTKISISRPRRTAPSVPHRPPSSSTT